MNITELLKQGDPVAIEPSLAPDDLQRMRRLVTTTVPEPALAMWPRPVFVAVTLSAALAASVAVGRQLPRPQPPRADVLPGGVSETATRQLQFETPGGTRIIWTFNPDFKL